MKVPAIPGADEVVAWLGRWTAFHDFYLLAAPAKGDTSGVMRIHGWSTDWDTTDDDGYFLTKDHGVVAIELEEISSVSIATDPEMTDFPAILSELVVEPVGEEWCLRWTSSYGAEGQVVAKRAGISLKLGRPEAAETGS